MKYLLRLRGLLLAFAISLPLTLSASVELAATSISSQVLNTIDYSSHKSAPKLKTKLSTALGKKANFAGKYVAVHFGCGANCHAFAFINITNGKVYFGPSAALGYEYTLNSNLLIVNPLSTLIEFYGSEAEATKEGDLFKSSRYIWNEKTNSFNELNEL